jgi:hypothetical protein
VLVKQNGLPPMRPGLEGREAFFALQRKEWGGSGTPESLIFGTLASKKCAQN